MLAPTSGLSPTSDQHHVRQLRVKILLLLVFHSLDVTRGSEMNRSTNRRLTVGGDSTAPTDVGVATRPPTCRQLHAESEDTPHGPLWRNCKKQQQIKWVWPMMTGRGLISVRANMLFFSPGQTSHQNFVVLR